MVKAGPKKRRAREEEAKALAIAEHSRKLANGSRRASKVRQYQYRVRPRKAKPESKLNPYQPSNNKGLSELAQYMEKRPADIAPIDWYRSWVGHAHRKRNEELSALALEVIEAIKVLVKMKMDTHTPDICDMLDANPRSIAGTARHMEHRGYIVRSPTGWKEVSLG